MRAVTFALALATMSGYGPVVLADSPPLTDGWYVDEGACPFEGCSYKRNWSVETDTILFDRPRGTRQIGSARKGMKVRGETGIVFTRPIPMTVVFPTKLEAYSYARKSVFVHDLRPGDRIYLLTYEGEGFNVAWFAGQLLSLDIGAMHDRSVHRFKSCDTPSGTCWWTIPEGRRERDSEWWAKVRLPDGIVGWTRETDNFGNIGCIGAVIDPCG